MIKKNHMPNQEEATSHVSAGLIDDRDRMFDLYVARVTKAETVQTVRRDMRAIFRDALSEAKVALEVYLESEKEASKDE